MKHVTHGLVASVLGAGLAVTATAQADDQSINCGKPHTVVIGDTLSRISQRAYGQLSFQALHDHNFDVIGANPHRIFVG